MNALLSFVTGLSIVLIFVFIGLTIFLVLRGSRIRDSVPESKVVDTTEEWVAYIQNAWQGVGQHLNSLNPSDWKMAIIEADKLIDDILTYYMGLKGESMAERLTLLSKEQLSSLDLLWEAHKTRNRIVHEPGYKIEQSEAKKIVSYYEEVLKEMKTL